MFDKFNDECAIFGLSGHAEASNLALTGPLRDAAPGQESAGIAAADGHRVIVTKDMGYVADIFTSERLAPLTGHAAIGHTRYLNGRCEPPDQRPADSDRLCPRSDCHRPQRQSGQRAGAEGPPGPARLDLPDVERHRSHPAPVCAVAGGDDRRRDHRVDLAGARCLFAGDADAQTGSSPRAIRMGSGRWRSASWAMPGWPARKPARWT